MACDLCVAVGPNYHIEISLLSKQMLATLYGGGVITILPKSTLSPLSLIVPPSCSAGHPLDRPWNYISASVTDNKQMNVIRSHHVVQDHQSIAVLGLQ